MTTPISEPYPSAENDNTGSQRRLLTGLLVGPVVYTVYFFAVYLLVEAACRENLLRRSLWGLDGLTAAVLGLTGGAVLLTLLLTVFTYRGRPAATADAQHNHRFVEQVSLWLSGFFVVVTLVTGVPILFLEQCRWV